MKLTMKNYSLLKKSDSKKEIIDYQVLPTLFFALSGKRHKVKKKLNL